MHVCNPKLGAARPPRAKTALLNSTGKTEYHSVGLPRLAYCVRDAAAVCGFSKSKCWELIKSGELRSLKIAGRRLIRHSDLLAFLNSEGE